MFKEDNLQMASAQYFDYLGILWCHVANERKATKKQGVRLKKKGVKPGVPDCFVFEPRGPYKGLVIELKIKPNKLTAHQKKWLSDLQNRGWAGSVAYSFDQVKTIIDNYLKLPPADYVICPVCQEVDCECKT